MKKKVSFDFDDCLGHSAVVLEYCKQLVKRKDVEVWIVTSRPRDPETFFRQRYEDPEAFKRDWGVTCWANEEDLYPLAASLGIPKSRIVFTEWEPKAYWFKQHGPDFVWHLDDNRSEIGYIAALTKVVPISCVGGKQFIHKCNRLLNNAKS